MAHIYSSRYFSERPFYKRFSGAGIRVYIGKEDNLQ